LTEPGKLPPDLAALHRELGIPADYAARRGLPLHANAEASTLVTVARKADGTPVPLIAPAAAAWTNLHGAAARDGLVLTAISGYRSVGHQADLIRRKLTAGQSIHTILVVMAAPGFSEHHTGRALDLGTPDYPDLEEAFADSPAFAWLGRRAADFGFRLSFPPGNPSGFIYEPWHWCWVE